ncbi:hypothetical protein [Rhodobacteraceae bacterium DSL-40]|uniref:hypothetical protein n=1 Tax=Amaricoccus sp. B4 TaxID=3368557 RepID=UPI000DAC7BC5
MTESNNDQAAARDLSAYQEKMADKDFLGRLYSDQEGVRRGAMAEIRPYREAALRAAPSTARSDAGVHFGATASVGAGGGRVLTVPAMTAEIKKAQADYDALANSEEHLARKYGSREQDRRAAVIAEREAWDRVLKAAGKGPKP